MDDQIPQPDPPPRPAEVLAEEDWRARRAAHETRVDLLLAPHLRRRKEFGADSIYEFMLTYYFYRPSQLRRWHPGLGTALIGARLEEFGAGYGYDEAGRLGAQLTELPIANRDAVKGIDALLRRTHERAPSLGCFALHEWAMVYRQPDAANRHAPLRLRLGTEQTWEVLEQARLRCTHFDATRFFTAAASARNELAPTRASQAEYEQPGCLHANMDLYKWAYKLAPLTSAELIADCFALAAQIREVDVRASPYDVTRVGLEPIAIETPEGRGAFVELQRHFAEEAGALRARLIEVCARARS